MTITPITQPTPKPIPGYCIKCRQRRLFKPAKVEISNMELCNKCAKGEK